MASFQSVKERIGAVNGLGCLLQALENQLITIDLENESTVTGIVLEVDGFMNVTLSEAQVVDLDCYCQHYDMLYVKGRIIRYVHIPKQLSVRETISQYLRKSSRIHRPESSTARSLFRRKKLLRYQEETKSNLLNIKKDRTQAESNT